MPRQELAQHLLVELLEQDLAGALFHENHPHMTEEVGEGVSSQVHLLLLPLVGVLRCVGLGDVPDDLDLKMSEGVRSRPRAFMTLKMRCALLRSGVLTASRNVLVPSMAASFTRFVVVPLREVVAQGGRVVPDRFLRVRLQSGVIELHQLLRHSVSLDVVQRRTSRHARATSAAASAPCPQGSRRLNDDLGQLRRELRGSVRSRNVAKRMLSVVDRCCPSITSARWGRPAHHQHDGPEEVRLVGVPASAPSRSSAAGSLLLTPTRRAVDSPDQETRSRSRRSSGARTPRRSGPLTACPLRSNHRAPEGVQPTRPCGRSALHVTGANGDTASRSPQRPLPPRRTDLVLLREQHDLSFLADACSRSSTARCGGVGLER